MKLSKKSKRTIRKFIKGTCMLIAASSFWTPFCVYVATREVVPSIITLAVGIFIIFKSCVVYNKMEEIGNEHC